MQVQIAFHYLNFGGYHRYLKNSRNKTRSNIRGNSVIMADFQTDMLNLWYFVDKIKTKIKTSRPSFGLKDVFKDQNKKIGHKE